MKTMFKRIKIFVCAILIPLFWTSCQDEMEDYYEVPNWLRGSIYEVLEERGNYSIFLEGVEIADYTALLKGRAIMTIMAPDDDAFRKYLRENYQTESIHDLDTAEVKKLIGFHCLYYSFDKAKLMNFRPLEGDGATEEEKLQNAGLYYKFRTRSQDAPSQATPKRMFQVTNVSTGSGEIRDTSGVTVDVYHLERFLPVFSHNMFETKLIDAKKNYEYFFPETEWKGDDGFNVANAIVTEYEIMTKNGYIYCIDKVLRPLETIHTELEKNEEYSRFLELYDQYAYYEADANLTNNYGGGTKTYYQRLYESRTFPLAAIDSEWPVTQYSAMSVLSSVAYSIFAPTNAAFDEFYTSYWGDEDTGYPTEVSYDSISSDAIGYLLSNCICSNFGTSAYSFSYLAFPDEIAAGKIVNQFTGMTIKFDPYDETAIPKKNRKMCVNGVLYGQNILTPPSVFGSVTGPAYKYKRYSNFLQMLSSSDMGSTLSQDAVSFIALYPSNAQFEANNIWYDEKSGKLKNGPVGSAQASNLGSATQQDFVNSHVVSLDGASMEGLPTGNGIKVFRTLSTNYKLYWYVKNGKITNSFKYNSLIEYAGNTDADPNAIYADFKELTFRGQPWSNGHCYEYDTENQAFLLEGSNENAIYANFVPLMYSHRNDEGTLFQGFIQMLILAEMIDEQAQTMNFMTEDCIMLIPTTEAIKKAILEGRFPYVTTTSQSADDPNFWANCTTDPATLTDFQHYMLEYFLPESTAPCSNYPYIGWGEDIEKDGGIPTIADISVTPAVSATVYIKDEGNKLTAWVEGAEAKKVNFLGKYDYLPFVFDDGCVHFIEDVFEDKWPR